MQYHENIIFDVTLKDRPLINNCSSVHADAQVHYNNFQVEETIVDITTKDRPVIKKKDGRNCPQNPTNGDVSQFVDGFNGCLHMDLRNIGSEHVLIVMKNN